MSNPLRIGITGCGNLGRVISGSAGQYGAKIVATHDAFFNAAERLASDFPGAKACADFDELFAVPMDALVVTTPPPVRLEPVTRACGKGIHLFVEKPPAMNLEEGRSCLAAIEKAGVISALGFNLRYEGRYSQLQKLVEGQEIHLVRSVCTIDYYLNFKMSPWFLQKKISGGPIAEQAIHPLDCIRFVLGNRPPKNALLTGAKNMALDRGEFDAENALQMVYELEGGVFGTHMNHCGHERFCFDIEIVGPQLRLHANLTEPVIRGHINGRDIQEAVQPYPRGLGKVESWLRAIESGDRTWIQSDYRDSLHTLSLVEAAIRSQTTRKLETCQGI